MRTLRKRINCQRSAKKTPWTIQPYPQKKKISQSSKKSVARWPASFDLRSMFENFGEKSEMIL